MSNPITFLEKRCPRYDKIPVIDQEYKNIIEWVTSYFSNGLIVPEINYPIVKVETNKTFISWNFKQLYKNIRDQEKLPYSLFELVLAIFPKKYKITDYENFIKTRNPYN